MALDCACRGMNQYAGIWNSYPGTWVHVHGTHVLEYWIRVLAYEGMFWGTSYVCQDIGMRMPVDVINMPAYAINMPAYATNMPAYAINMLAYGFHVLRCRGAVSARGSTRRPRQRIQEARESLFSLGKTTVPV